MNISTKSFIEKIENWRREAKSAIPAPERSAKGQFFTSLSIASFMASLFSVNRERLTILDPGAGTGMLSAACVMQLCSREKPPRSLEITAYESDSRLIEYLRKGFHLCAGFCEERGIEFRGDIIAKDFLKEAVAQVSLGLFRSPSRPFDLAILNPPYKKIKSQSETRQILNRAGIETGNLYSAFIWLSSRLLHENGELVAISPRSFCNGPYFKTFRRNFLAQMSLRRIHIFESRKFAFREDGVLQENIIFHAARNAKPPKKLLVSVSKGDDFVNPPRTVDYADVVHPGDSDLFIHIPTDDMAKSALKGLSNLPATIEDLGISVSTGPVVDFRARKYLRAAPSANSAPLIHPCHFSEGFISWPKLAGKKANAIEISAETEALLVPSGYYVLVKRFSSKEERRRVVAALYDPQKVPASRIGFENHLNFFHSQSNGLPPNLAKGLALFLNSTIADRYFRQFSGHTQINAADLKKLRYPSRHDLIKIGTKMNDLFPSQAEVNMLVEELITNADKK